MPRRPRTAGRARRSSRQRHHPSPPTGPAPRSARPGPVSRRRASRSRAPRSPTTATRFGMRSARRWSWTSMPERAGETDVRSRTNRFPTNMAAQTTTTSRTTPTTIRTGSMLGSLRDPLSARRRRARRRIGRRVLELCRGSEWTMRRRRAARHVAAARSHPPRRASRGRSAGRTPAGDPRQLLAHRVAGARIRAESGSSSSRDSRLAREGAGEARHVGARLPRAGAAGRPQALRCRVARAGRCACLPAEARRSAAPTCAGTGRSAGKTSPTDRSSGATA